MRMNWSDVSKFGSFTDGSSFHLEWVGDDPELRLRKINKEGVAVIKFGVNERDGPNSGKVECFLFFEDREWIGSKI